MKKEIYDDKIGLSKKEINKKLTSAKENNLKTMIVTNLFIDDTETRHTEVDKEIEENTRRAGSSAIAKSVDYWQPNEANMNILFDNWEKMILKKAEKWKDSDYLIITPEDTSFEFITHKDLQNERNKQLLKKVREVYNGKVCFSFKISDINYFSHYNNFDYYKEADCLVLGGHFDFSKNHIDKDLNSIESFFNKYFSNPFFEENKKQEIFVMISSMSYDKYLEDGWFEIWDYEHFGLKYNPDYKLQATIYEAFFRTIQNQEPKIKGIIHYGYWWEDIDPDNYFVRVDFANSIRNKDAEHIFYRWSRVLKN
jgi:hypothetical protein